jgi:hypothetical protein
MLDGAELVVMFAKMRWCLKTEMLLAKEAFSIRHTTLPVSRKR